MKAIEKRLVKKLKFIVKNQPYYKITVVFSESRKDNELDKIILQKTIQTLPHQSFMENS